MKLSNTADLISSNVYYLWIKTIREYRKYYKSTEYDMAYTAQTSGILHVKLRILQQNIGLFIVSLPINIYQRNEFLWLHTTKMSAVDVKQAFGIHLSLCYNLSR